MLILNLKKRKRKWSNYCNLPLIFRFVLKQDLLPFLISLISCTALDLNSWILDSVSAFSNFFLSTSMVVCSIIFILCLLFKVQSWYCYYFRLLTPCQIQQLPSSWSICWFHFSNLLHFSNQHYPAELWFLYRSFLFFFKVQVIIFVISYKYIPLILFSQFVIWYF